MKYFKQREREEKKMKEVKQKFMSMVKFLIDGAERIFDLKYLGGIQKISCEKNGCDLRPQVFIELIRYKRANPIHENIISLRNFFQFPNVSLLRRYISERISYDLTMYIPNKAVELGDADDNIIMLNLKEFDALRQEIDKFTNCIIMSLSYANINKIEMNRTENRFTVYHNEDCHIDPINQSGWKIEFISIKHIEDEHEQQQESSLLPKEALSHTSSPQEA